MEVYKSKIDLLLPNKWVAYTPVDQETVQPCYLDINYASIYSARAGWAHSQQGAHACGAVCQQMLAELLAFFSVQNAFSNTVGIYGNKLSGIVYPQKKKKN